MFYEMTLKRACLKLLRAYVPTCLRACAPSFFTCLHAYMCIYIFRAYVSLCLKLFRTYVHSFLHFYLRAYNHSKNILRFIFMPCIAVFSELFDLLFHSKPQNKLLLLKLHTPTLSCGGFFISSTAYTETKI